LRRLSSRASDPHTAAAVGPSPGRPRATRHVQGPERDQSMEGLLAADDLDAPID